MNSLKCVNCGLINFATAVTCQRCGNALSSLSQTPHEADADRRSVFTRAAAILTLACFLLLVCYASLLGTSSPITFAQREIVDRAIGVIEDNGFAREAFVLRYGASYRATDHWWNRWIGHGDAYAATNFPFEVVTLYPDFFSVPTDDIERAVILLHEANHLVGKGEPAAFANVWRGKKRLGWTRHTHSHTHIWNNVREFTIHYAPNLFQCGLDAQSDCTE